MIRRPPAKQGVFVARPGELAPVAHGRPAALYLSGVGEGGSERTPLAEPPLKRRRGNNIDVGHQFGAGEVVCDRAGSWTSETSDDGRSDLNEGRYADAPSTGRMVEVKGGRTNHQDLLDSPTIDTVGVATNSTQEHVGKILLALLIGVLVNKENHLPGASRFLGGTGTGKHGR